MISGFSRVQLGMTLVCAALLFSSHSLASSSVKATSPATEMTKVAVDAKELVQAAAKIQAAKPKHERGSALVIKRHPDGTLTTFLGGQEVILDLGGAKQ
jgi:hypothetical protein